MPNWMFVGPIVAALAASPASHALDGTAPYARHAPASWRAVETITSNAASGIEAMDGTRRVGAIVYDPEPKLTPAEDVANISDAETRVCAAAHRIGALCIETPVGPRDFTATAIDTACRVADAVDFQLQLQEIDVARYSANAHAAASRCRALNPKIKIILGITTRAGKTTNNATPEQIEAAIDATSDVADRYWFNAPKPGRVCPYCGPFSPEIAEAVIQHYASQRR